MLQCACLRAFNPYDAKEKGLWIAPQPPSPNLFLYHLISSIRFIWLKEASPAAEVASMR